jgi:aspartyl-tRNA(Asn)/glutamyl-tRNA(Gln) amidotransferase subunit C
MAARITKDEVRKVARLARLALSDAEVETMERELGSILGSMESLGRLDVAGVQPTFHAIEMATPLRDDVVVPGLRRSEALGAAAKTEAGAFSVPKVMEGE